MSKAPAESVSLQMFKNAKYRSLLIQTEFLGSGLGRLTGRGVVAKHAREVDP